MRDQEATMMDEEFERRPVRSVGGVGKSALNILTLFILLTTLCLVGALLAVFINPYISINPYPPPTVPATLGSPTPSNTPALALPPTWTPTPSHTPAPTNTPQPTDTPVPIVDTPTPEAVPPFALQVGSPARIQNYLNDAECEWMGVMGQVFDLENAPILNLSVHLVGELEGVGEIDLWAITGSAPDVGPGGYLFNIADHPIASEGTLWIQVDDGGGTALSEMIYLDSSESCSENLIMVNWRQIR
jgi:hypothetical protein